MSFSLQTRILEVGVSTTFGSANLPEYSQRSSVLLSIPRAFAIWTVEYSGITCITIGVFDATVKQEVKSQSTWESTSILFEFRFQPLALVSNSGTQVFERNSFPGSTPDLIGRLPVLPAVTKLMEKAD
jgi:hypothetical protein